MKGSMIGDVLTGLIFVALATTLVSHKGTSTDISAAGNAFSTSIKAATGSASPGY
jgi:hypothetical protein